MHCDEIVSDKVILETPNLCMQQVNLHDSPGKADSNL